MRDPLAGTSTGYRLAKGLQAHRALGRWSDYPLVARTFINSLAPAERQQLQVLLQRRVDRPLITKHDTTEAERALLRRIYEHLVQVVRVVMSTTTTR